MSLDPCQRMKANQGLHLQEAAHILPFAIGCVRGVDIELARDDVAN